MCRFFFRMKASLIAIFISLFFNSGYGFWISRMLTRTDQLDFKQPSQASYYTEKTGRLRDPIDNNANRASMKGRFQLNPLQMDENDDIIPSSIEITNFTGTGCVLVIHNGDYDHFLMKQAVFIFRHNDEGTSGVILSKQTAFTMGEVSPNISPFEANTLYMGGNDGADMATMLHRHNLPGSKYVGAGIYLGGIRSAQEFVKQGNASPKEFKFFFNSVEWAPKGLDKEIEQGRWHVVRAPPDMVLGPKSTELWSLANNFVMSRIAGYHTGRDNSDEDTLV